jgi:hypothetical protein
MICQSAVPCPVNRAASQATAGGTGLVDHARAILLRKAADQTGLTGQLSAALLRKGSPPLLDRDGVSYRPPGPGPDRRTAR